MVTAAGPYPVLYLLSSMILRVQILTAYFEVQFTGALNPPVPIIKYRVEFSRFSSLFDNLGPNDTSVVRYLALSDHLITFALFSESNSNAVP